MIDIGVLRAMAAAGATVEMILSAIEADQKIQTNQLAARRANDAERQRRRRARHVTSRESHGQPVTVCDANLHIDKNLTSLKDSEIKKTRKKTISAPLPADWKPTPVGHAFATAKKGWDNQRVDSEGERFRDHSLAKGLTHRDVEAAWRNWVTSPYQAKANGARASPGALPRPGSREDRQEKTYNAYQKLRQHAHPQADEPRECDVARDAPTGFLPFAKPA